MILLYTALTESLIRYLNLWLLLLKQFRYLVRMLTNIWLEMLDSS